MPPEFHCINVTSNSIVFSPAIRKLLIYGTNA